MERPIGQFELLQFIPESSSEKLDSSMHVTAPVFVPIRPTPVIAFSGSTDLSVCALDSVGANHLVGWQARAGGASSIEGAPDQHSSGDSRTGCYWVCVLCDGGSKSVAHGLVKQHNIAKRLKKTPVHTGSPRVVPLEQEHGMTLDRADNNDEKSRCRWHMSESYRVSYLFIYQLLLTDYVYVPCFVIAV